MNRMRTSVVLRAATVVALGLVVGTSVLRGQRERRNRIPVTSRLLESVKSLTCGFRPADNVTVKLVGGTLHFVDIGLNGTLGVLTVFARESRDGRLQAVYSRASYAESGGFGTPAPPVMSQFYGDCEIGSR
jgi:hypothetical protein